MCGILAAFWKHGYRKDFIATAVEQISHRGIRTTKKVFPQGFICHSRLPIVGVGEENDQPIEVGPETIAFVGEILNFKDIDPSAECDLKVVANAWEKGLEEFRKFDGFWHVLGYNPSNGKLRVLVDYLAQKPVYVLQTNNFLAVSSELDSLSALSGGWLSFDEVYLSSVIKWGYCPEPWRTPYREVRHMLPGELMEADTKNLSCPATYTVVDRLVGKKITDSQLKTEIVQATIRRVLSSDVPVACLVSGGLDSSIVYEIAKQYGNIKAYHVENREIEEALLVAPEAIVLGLEDISMAKGLDYMQEPIDLGSLLPQTALSDAVGASGAERVCLTGDGADELFGGYGRALRYDSQASDVWQELVAWHLPRLDRVMMRNLVEVRSPFLARKVVEAALGLPWGYRRNKNILRNIFRLDLPFRIVDRLKRPLRTKIVERGREENSQKLVNLFIKERDRHAENT